MSWEFTPPPVEALWRRWYARFLASADPMVVNELREQITSWDQWCAAWSTVAKQAEDWAKRALEKGDRLTAADLLVRASVLYHIGGMVFLSDMDQFEEAERKRVETFRRGGAMLPVPTQPITVPFKGVDLPGYLRVPPADGPVPVVVFTYGWEGCKEGFGTAGNELVARGVATLALDGPGIGETVGKLPFSGEFGPVLAAAYDVLEQHPDIDGDRMGVAGGSRGGLPAARAAAYEKRCKAVASVGPGWETRMINWGPGMESLAAVYVQRMFHADSQESLAERLQADDLSLEGVGERITCPALVFTDDQESDAQHGGTMRFYEEIAGPKELLVISGAERNGLARAYLMRPLVADWLARQLGAGA